MKNIIYILSTVLLLTLFNSCGKDNYDEPDVNFTGRVTYQGKAINVRGTDQRVRLQLYQDGYAKRDPIEVFVTQDGSFSAKLFNGDYKLVAKDRTGPWVNNRDTTVVKIKGDTDINFEVVPFFMISNENISISGNTMTATFNIEQVASTAVMNRVLLLLNTTSFVDNDYKVFQAEYNQNLVTGQVTYTADLTGNEKVANAQFLYGRVCVWANGAEQGIYSPVVRLK